MPIITQPADLPEWASDETQVLEPSEAKKDLGFNPSEKPANQTLNWIFWDNFKWAEYAKSYFNTITNSNVVFDDTLKTLKVAQGHFQSEKADTSTTQLNNSLTRIVVRNSSGTANNFADFSFANQNDVITSKVSSKFVNHTNGETNLSIWATTSDGVMTEYLRINGGGSIQALAPISSTGSITALNTSGIFSTGAFSGNTTLGTFYNTDASGSHEETIALGGGSGSDVKIVCESNNAANQHSRFIVRARRTAGTLFDVINANGDSNITDVTNNLIRLFGNSAGFGVQINQASTTGEVTRFEYAGNGAGDTTNFVLRMVDGVSTVRANMTRNGDWYNATGTYAIFSDLRLKDNIETARSYLDDVCSLRLVTYSKKEELGSKYLGFIAQEVQEVFPGLVSNVPLIEKDEDGNEIEVPTLTVKQSILINMLVGCVQDLKTKNDDLEARIAALETA